MIVQFFNRGTGRGAGPIDYLLGRQRDREFAKLLRGNPEETAALIDSSDYAKKYTSGCLSFEEIDIDEKLKQALMDGFEECLFTGLDVNQYNCLWVEHRDKGRLELNFVIPNIELTTGKRLQPYWHAADQQRVNAWKDIQNHDHHLSDPNDPFKRQLTKVAKDLPRGTAEAAKAISEGISALIQSGDITNRDDVLKVLTGAGLEIARTTPTSISIKNPDGGRNIRLKGAFYEQALRIDEEFRERVEEEAGRYSQGLRQSVSAARELYREQIAAKQQQNARRYQQPKPSSSTENRNIELELPRVIAEALRRNRPNDSTVYTAVFRPSGANQLTRKKSPALTVQTDAMGSSGRGMDFDSGASYLGSRLSRGQTQQSTSLSESRNRSAGAASQSNSRYSNQQLSANRWQSDTLCSDRSTVANLGKEPRISSYFTEKGLIHDRNRDDAAASARALRFGQETFEYGVVEFARELAESPRPLRTRVIKRIREIGWTYQDNNQARYISERAREITERNNKILQFMARFNREVIEGFKYGKPPFNSIDRELSENKRGLDKASDKLSRAQYRIDRPTEEIERSIGAIRGAIEGISTLNQQYSVTNEADVPEKLVQRKNNDRDYDFGM